MKFVNNLTFTLELLTSLINKLYNYIKINYIKWNT